MRNRVPRDRVVEICERQYDLLVKEAFEERCRLAKPAFHFGRRTEQELHAELVREVARTLAAQWHEESAPAWACQLPVELQVCESLIYNDCNALKLLGYYGRSMLWSGWNFERHPDFNTYCRGIMASRIGPMDVRMDEELLQMFPPKALAGLTTPLQWRSPGT
jgi:hypothetical protein